MVVDWEEWMWREMREGGYLKQYLARERHTSRKRIRRVAKAMHGFKQNNHSEHQLKAAVPMREFFRWKAEDNDFWRDDSNLRSLKRDNPDMAIFV